ncbi:MAG: LysR family transcriptional regulator [Asticcacaulis sp.]|uniref:LysR family transcriptional regulator n=1 Tax=Asticcacaulis sp. TaxID=1872648 RepID=UPI0039E630D7
MMNFQWLRTFTVLAELGSFTRAAERLGLTQAAVSQHIGHLEDQLGPLLLRRPRNLELTPAGIALLQYGKEVEQADQRLKVRLADNEAENGEISLISPGSVGLSLYPLLLELQEANPGFAVRHRFAPDREVLDAVLQNLYELGLASFKPDDPRLTATPFSEEPLELVVPANENVQDWSDLERLGFIDHPDGQAMAGRLLGKNFPRNPGIRSLPCKGFSNQIGLILEPVARGLGFTIIPQYARQAFVRSEAIRVIEFENPVVDTLWLIHRSEWPLSARAQHVVDYLKARISS